MALYAANDVKFAEVRPILSVGDSNVARESSYWQSMVYGG